MPHGNTDSTQATAQNAATEPQAPNDPGAGQEAAAQDEARSYAAPDFRDATLAAPAAGEVGDYADLDEPSGGMQQGRNHRNWEAHAHDGQQGPKTQQANRDRASGGSPDQGTQ